jgi:hypothetical protein
MATTSPEKLWNVMWNVSGSWLSGVVLSKSRMRLMARPDLRQKHSSTAKKHGWINSLRFA